MDFEKLKKAIDVTPVTGDTSRTSGWKYLLQTAKTCEKKGDVPKAMALYRRCLELSEARLGANHIILSHILMQLARLHEVRGEMKESKELNDRARELIAEFAYANMPE